MRTLGIVMLGTVALFVNCCGQGPNGGDAMFKRHTDTDVTGEPKYNFKSYALVPKLLFGNAGPRNSVSRPWSNYRAAASA